MKRCPSCGQDNPDIFTHCEWCGKSLKSAKTVERLENRQSEKGSNPKKAFGGRKRSDGKATRFLAGISIAIIIACLVFISCVFRFNLIFTVLCCLFIILAYLLNCFPKLFLRNKEVKKSRKLILSLISLIAIAIAAAMLYLSVITA